MYASKVAEGEAVKLSTYDPDHHAGLDKEDGRKALAALSAELDALQEELYAAGHHSLLMILQGMDTSGKDGAIRSVLSVADPQGVRVESFKVPTEEELAHDFLWRVHKVAPRRGQLGVFNRSHYEDVLVGRVRADRWRSVRRRSFSAGATSSRLPGRCEAESYAPRVGVSTAGRAAGGGGANGARLGCARPSRRARGERGWGGP